AEQLNPLALNNRAAANNRKIAKSATELRTLLLQLQTGKNVSPAAVRSAYENVRRTVAEVKADMAGIAPNYLPAAQSFYPAYNGFLDGQETLVREDLQKVVQVV